MYTLGQGEGAERKRVKVAFSFDPAFFQLHIKSHAEEKYPGSRGPRERTAVRASRPARVKEPFQVQSERAEKPSRLPDCHPDTPCLCGAAAGAFRVEPGELASPLHSQ